MDSFSREKLLSGIITGIVIYKFDGRSYYIHPPTTLLRQESFLYYDEIYDGLAQEDFFSQEEIRDFLVRTGLVPKDLDEQVEKLRAAEEELKVQCYKSWTNTKQVKTIKDSIRSTTRTMATLLAGRHSLDHVTREGYAEYCRRTYLITHSTLLKNGSRAKISGHAILCDRLYRASLDSLVGITELRDIARNEPWRNIWGADSINPFGRIGVDLTDNQKNLIHYSKLYENIFKHPECPVDGILNDDDALDGWLIVQRRNAENGKKSDVDPYGDASEVYLPANSPEDIKKIQAMNSTEGRKIIQQRQEALQKSGKLKESQLPDVQKKLQMEVAQQFRSKMKGK